MLNSYPYILLIGFYLLLFFIRNTFHSRNEGVLRIVVLGTFIIFFGFRGFIGWDWASYYPFYEGLGKNLASNIKNNFLMASGFTVYSTFIKYFFKNYHLYIFINTLIDAIILDLFFKKYLPRKLYVLGFIIFLAMGGIMLEVDNLRNLKAILLFLISLKYLKERNPIPYFALNFLGLLFHFSAIVYFPLYFFFHKPIPKKWILVIFIIGNLIFFAKIQYIKPLLFYIASRFGDGYSVSIKIINYTNSGVNGISYGFSIGYFERFFSTILILLNYNKLIKISKSYVIFINAFVAYIIANLYLYEMNVLVVRIGDLFIFSYWILWPSLYYILKSNKKIIGLALISMYVFLKIYFVTDIAPYNYDNVLTGIKTYNERFEILEQVGPQIVKKNMK